VSSFATSFPLRLTSALSLETTAAAVAARAAAAAARAGPGVCACPGAGAGAGAGAVGPGSKPHILMQHVPDLDQQRMQTGSGRRDGTNPFPRDRFSQHTGAGGPPQQQQQMQMQSQQPRGEEAYEERHGGDPTMSGQAAEERHLPTPKEIFTGLNEYVIGQHNVKVALSVGVHNHYKRISVVEAQRAAEERIRAVMETDGTAAPGVSSHPHEFSSSHPARGGADGPLSDLNLEQFGRSGIGGGASIAGVDGPSPFDDVRSIAAPADDTSTSSAGRSVDNCELDKSNIIIIGPTGMMSGLACSRCSFLYVGHNFLRLIR